MCLKHKPPRFPHARSRWFVGARSYTLKDYRFVGRERIDTGCVKIFAQPLLSFGRGGVSGMAHYDRHSPTHPPLLIHGVVRARVGQSVSEGEVVVDGLNVVPRQSEREAIDLVTKQRLFQVKDMGVLPVLVLYLRRFLRGAQEVVGREGGAGGWPAACGGWGGSGGGGGGSRAAAAAAAVAAAVAGLERVEWEWCVALFGDVKAGHGYGSVGVVGWGVVSRTTSRSAATPKASATTLTTSPMVA